MIKFPNPHKTTHHILQNIHPHKNFLSKDRAPAKIGLKELGSGVPGQAFNAQKPA